MVPEEEPQLQFKPLTIREDFSVPFEKAPKKAPSSIGLENFDLMLSSHPRNQPTIGASCDDQKAIPRHYKHREQNYPRALAAFRSSPD
jgi:hypothetical protein